jgi:hypothetical protein
MMLKNNMIICLFDKIFAQWRQKCLAGFESERNWPLGSGSVIKIYGPTHIYPDPHEILTDPEN